MLLPYGAYENVMSSSNQLHFSQFYEDLKVWAKKNYEQCIFVVARRETLLQTVQTDEPCDILQGQPVGGLQKEPVGCLEIGVFQNSIKLDKVRFQLQGPNFKLSVVVYEWLRYKNVCLHGCCIIWAALQYF